MDAIRDIWGSFNPYTDSAGGLGLVNDGTTSGAFYPYGSTTDTVARGGVTTNSSRYYALQFSASLVVPIAAENRPVNHTIRIWECVA